MYKNKNLLLLAVIINLLLGCQSESIFEPIPEYEEFDLHGKVYDAVTLKEFKNAKVYLHRDYTDANGEIKLQVIDSTLSDAEGKYSFHFKPKDPNQYFYLSAVSTGYFECDPFNNRIKFNTMFSEYHENIAFEPKGYLHLHIIGDGNTDELFVSFEKNKVTRSFKKGANEKWLIDISTIKATEFSYWGKHYSDTAFDIRETISLRVPYPQEILSHTIHF